MIRRRVELSPDAGPGSSQFWLIAQDDHAKLAGELAAAFGNGLFAPPADRDRVVLGTSLHDAGWPLHDEAPELNADGLPSDVFETPIRRGVRVWEAGAARAEAIDAYAGLLVSIHVQRLAGFADREPAKLTNRERFWLIRFRNDQAQRQMRLRQRLGLHIDRPLDHGLALPDDAQASRDPAEQRLAYDVRLLQAMDLLSLCACCTAPPATSVGPLPRRPGGPSLALAVSRPSAGRLVVDPWPFGSDSVRLAVPYRAVPAQPFQDAGALRGLLATAPRCTFDVLVVPRNALSRSP